MKQKTILMAVACLLLSAVAAFAQSKTDFSGEWTLDVSKSKLPEMMRIEGGTIKVTQTDKDISYITDFKRTPRPEGAAGGGQGGGGGRGMGGGTAAPQIVKYTLDGKETTVETPGPQGTTIPAKLTSSWDGGKLKLTSVRTFNTPNGEMTATQKETWEVVDGGKGLKVVRETESPRGNQTAEFYYAKK
jgi:hypothetical protein